MDKNIENRNERRKIDYFVHESSYIGRAQKSGISAMYNRVQESENIAVLGRMSILPTMW